jgi:hypothetical protein
LVGLARSGSWFDGDPDPDPDADADTSRLGCDDQADHALS